MNDTPVNENAVRIGVPHRMGVRTLQIRRARAASIALTVLALLVVHALLADTSIEDKGLTYDESGHLMRGLSFWRHPDNRLIIHQPALAPAWAVLPLLDDDLAYPTLEQDSWYRCNVYEMADELLFHLGNDRDVLLRKAR